MTGSLIKKAVSMMLAGAVVLGGSVTALAAEEPATPPVAQEQARGRFAELRRLRQTLKEITERIAGQREELKGKLQEIRSLVEILKEDPERNQVPLELARAELRQLKLLNGDRKAINQRIQDARADLKAAIEARDGEAARQAADRLISLKLTKLELFQGANRLADQIIIHLNRAMGQE